MEGRALAGVRPRARTNSSQASVRREAAAEPRPARASGSRAAARASISVRGLEPVLPREGFALQAIVVLAVDLPLASAGLVDPGGFGIVVVGFPIRLVWEPVSPARAKIAA